MNIELLLTRFHAYGHAEALIWHDEPLHYSDLLASVISWQTCLADKGLPKGAIVALEGDYSPNSVALLLALLNINCIVVPLTLDMTISRAELHAIVGAEWLVQVDAKDEVTIRKCHTGHIVTAKVRLTTDETLRTFRSRLHRALKGKLDPYKIPRRVRLVNDTLHSARFKKIR